MLTLRQNLLVALPEVSIKRSFTIALRDTPPQRTTGPLTPITDGVGHHLAMCADTKPTRSTACSRALGRTTKARPTPEPLHLLGWRERGFVPGVASSLTFFEPASHGVARDTKDAREAAQGSAFVVGSEDLLLTSRIVSRALGILDEAAPAGSAAVTLLAFGGVSMPDATAAVTMWATGSISYYVFHEVR